MCSGNRFFCTRSIFILVQVITLSTSLYFNSTQPCQHLEAPKLVLKFEPARQKLLLLIYNPENLNSIKDEYLVFCFTNADEIHLKEKVKTKIIFKNLQTPNPFLVFSLKLKKYLGEYWCEAFTTNYCLANSNKILAYKRKRGQEYSLRLILHSICKISSCHLYDIFNFLKKQLDKILDFYKPTIRIMEVFDLNMYNDSADILVHISTERVFEKEEFGLMNSALKSKIWDIVYFRNSEFCLNEGIWPQTEIYNGAIAEDFCLLNDGTPVVRYCHGDFLHGAFWTPSKSCSSKVQIPQITQQLRNWTMNQPNWDKLKTFDFNILDIFYLNKILRKKLNNATVTFDVVQKLMKTKKSVLARSQKLLNLTDAILSTIDVNFETDLEKIGRNFIVLSTKPFVSNITGFGLYDNNSIRKLKRGENFENLPSSNLDVAIKVPEVVLEQILNETETNSSDVQIVFKIFTMDTFFLDSNYNSGSFVVEVSIPNFGSYLQSPIEILFTSRNNSRQCGFWDNGDKSNRKKGSWSLLGAQYFEKNNFQFCSYNHLTHFALLLMADRKIPIDVTTSNDLEIITIIGTTISCMGILGIFLTAAIFQKWRQKIGTKILLNLSLAIVAEILILSLTEIPHLRDFENSCKIIGVFLHFTVLSKFSWMLVYAYLQYCRFVRVLGAKPKNLIFKSVIIGWGIPLVFVFMTGLLTDISYSSVSYHLCYPRGLLLYLTVIIPICLIMIANIAVFCLVMYSIIYTVNNDNSKKIIKLRLYLAILLLSVLGFPWIFGILAEIFNVTIFFYIFCITGTLQGFILFLFYVILNKETRQFWLKKLRRNK